MTESMVHMALAVSEIRTQIGLFLSGNNHDIIACMLVCKAWRPDFRRLLYYELVLTRPTRGSIITPLQWRSNSTYTQSLVIEEPTFLQQGYNPGARGARSGKGTRATGSSDKILGTLRSLDYNLDPVLHCPNLQHLSVNVKWTMVNLFCWTKKDDWYEVGENGIVGEDDQNKSNGQDLLYTTTTAVKHSLQNRPYLVKTSNRILALLHHRPQLKSFRWTGKSTQHMDQLGRYFLTEKKEQLVELHLEALAASIPEINRIIANCPSLQRLCLKSSIIMPNPKWADLQITDSEQLIGELSAHFSPLIVQSPPPTTAAPLESWNVQLPPSPVILDLRNIQFLSLEAPRFPKQKIYIHGPSLKELHILRLANSAPISRTDVVGQPPQEGAYWHCPKLQVYLYRDTSHSFHDDFVFTSNIMESCGENLRQLFLTSSMVPTDFATDLISRNQGRSITHLDFSGSSWIKSKEIQSLLCSCPELIEFSGPNGVLWGEDIISSPGTWSCVKLKKLQVMVCMARPDSDKWEESIRQGRGPVGFPLRGIMGPNLSRFYPTIDLNSYEQQKEYDQNSNLSNLTFIQDGIFERLSKLKQLEILDLNGSSSKTSHFLFDYPIGISWTLETGLDKLKDLSKMKTLVVTGWEDKMTRREARWLKNYWPDLRLIINRNGNILRDVDSIDNTSSDTEAHSQSEDASNNEDNVDEIESKPDETQVVGWLAFRICLSQEWPERFSLAVQTGREEKSWTKHVE
ncbi:hypothetical protein BGZ76_006792 [Entomortierella beljakovae]|nr:hypothetical protein BGZ76_006792 [Entomortierella beljakovae]